jgi:outer membrane protein assembly factor BamB
MTITLALLLGLSQAATPAVEWNQWRGPKRDGLSPDTGLLKQWPAGGQALAWKATGVGLGYSSVSFEGSRIFTMGQVDGRTCLLALNLADGKILWKADVGGPGGTRGEGPRSTPATDGKLVVGLGQHGDLLCVNAADGKELWRKSFSKDFGGRMMSGWGFSESPLLDGDLVVCTPGGSKGTIAALKKSTGETVWQCAEVTDRAGYASVVPVEIGGVRQYLFFTDSNVGGIGAKDGKLLWRSERAGKTAIVDTPIYHDGIVFVSSAYGIGCHAFRVTASGGAFKSEPAYSGTQFSSHHGGAILVGEHVYGLGDGALKCVELKTGKVVWQDRSVGKGSIAYADGLLVCRGEKGSVALADASPAGYKEKGRFEQPDRSKEFAWAHPIVFGGKLYIRDQDVLLCYDVKAK